MGRVGCIFGNAEPALAPAQRDGALILQFTKQRPNIAFRYAIAAH